MVFIAKNLVGATDRLDYGPGDRNEFEIWLVL